MMEELMCSMNPSQMKVSFPGVDQSHSHFKKQNNTTMVYIELTTTTGKKVLVNLSQAQAILPSSQEGAKSHITGINNNGGIGFRETYEEIKEILKKVGGITIV